MKDLQPAAILRTDKNRVAADVGSDRATWSEPGITWYDAYNSFETAQKVNDAVGLDVPMEPLFTGQQIEDVIDGELENLEEMGHEECACTTAEEVLKRVKNSLKSGRDAE